jgi:hypothetical protein
VQSHRGGTAKPLAAAKGHVSSTELGSKGGKKSKAKQVSEIRKTVKLRKQERLRKEMVDRVKRVEEIVT